MPDIIGGCAAQPNGPMVTEHQSWTDGTIATDRRAHTSTPYPVTVPPYPVTVPPITPLPYPYRPWDGTSYPRPPAPVTWYLRNPLQKIEEGVRVIQDAIADLEALDPILGLPDLRQRVVEYVVGQLDPDDESE